MEETSRAFSQDEWKEIRADIWHERAKAGSTIHYIEHVWEQFLEDGNGFLPPHIHRLIEFVEGCIRDGVNGVALLPRGSSKSTSVTQGWLSKYIADNPDIRIGLMSNTATQAFAFSGAIRNCFEANDRFIALYGDCVSKKKWTDAEWLHRASKYHQSKDRTVYAQGVGGPIVSKRFDVVVLDDILDKENTANAEQMDSVNTWFWQTLKPCLVPGGVMIYIGTRWAEGDMAEQLTLPVEEGGKGWRSLVIPALSPLLDEEGQETGEEQSYWPARWPIERLYKEREEMGSAFFAVAYMNDLSMLMSGNVFPRMPMPDEQYFHTLPEGNYTLRMGIDLASSEKESADYTARAITAEDERGNFYVLSAYRDRRETHHSEFINDGFTAYPEIDLVVCENNQFQSTLIQTVMEDYPRIPITGVKADVDKVTRARAVAAKYEAHKVFHHISLKNTAFERELRGFPKGHDDFVDALGYSMELTGGGFFFGSLRRGSSVRS